ncbi:ribonuclease H [Senna tora]|uniref:Ribonuclease H n=1 Tax=Senna tora TaxID=362788 RepID=A0A834TLC9_9FABA|nr:ribonuclease H [Senna tora]
MLNKYKDSDSKLWKDLCKDNVNCTNSNTVVRDFLNYQGHWDQEKLRDLVPLETHVHALIVDKNSDFAQNPVKQGWEKPKDDWLKMNVDGAVCRVMGMAGCGGILRNSNGD